MSKRWSYKNANVGKQHPPKLHERVVDALLFSCLMEGGKGNMKGINSMESRHVPKIGQSSYC
jgi:hypothetical protein